MNRLADDDRAREIAAEILARPEYAQWRRWGEPEWTTSVFAWLRDALAWFAALPSERPYLLATIEIGLVLVAGLLTAHVLWSVRAALRASAPARRSDEVPDQPQWRARAEAAARAGDHLDAARLMQLATLDILMRRGLLHLGRSEPNRTLRARLREAPIDAPLRDRLIELIGRLETSWFRGRVADAALYADWLAVVRAVEAGR